MLLAFIAVSGFIFFHLQGELGWIWLVFVFLYFEFYFLYSNNQAFFLLLFIGL